MSEDISVSASNPYKPPDADLVAGHSEQAQAEMVREAYIRHEASVRSVGVLYYLGGIFGILMAITLLATGFDGVGAASARTFGYGVIAGALGVGLLVLGYAIRRLKRWVRVPVGILSVLGLIAFPLGTLVNLYVLVIVFNKKGRKVFSHDYAQIIRKTPDVKYRSSPLMMAALLLITLAIIAAVLIPAIR